MQGWWVHGGSPRCEVSPENQFRILLVALWTNDTGQTDAEVLRFPEYTTGQQSRALTIAG